MSIFAEDPQSREFPLYHYSSLGIRTNFRVYFPELFKWGVIVVTQPCDDQKLVLLALLNKQIQISHFTQPWDLLMFYVRALTQTYLKVARFRSVYFLELLKGEF